MENQEPNSKPTASEHGSGKGLSVQRLVSTDIDPPKIYALSEMRIGMRVRAWIDFEIIGDGEIVCLQKEGKLEEITIKFDDYEKPIGPYKPQRVQVLD